MLKKAKVLIIEDNAEMRENIHEILELSNYEVYAAADGLQGVQAARQHRPDLILCDIMMPNLDGFGVLKILSQDEQLRTTPFIFLTAKAEKEDFRKGMNLGAEDYLVKPFDDADLLHIIGNKLSKYEELSKTKATRALAGILPFDTLYTFPKVQALIESSEVREYGKKSKLWVSREKVNHLYFLETGLLKEGIETVGGKEFIFQFYSGPGLVGVQHLFQATYHSFCEVLEPSAVRALPRKQLEDIILRENLWTSFQHHYASLCQEHLSRLAINSFGNVREKVAYHLYLLSGNLKQDTLHLSREDLAAFCGIAKETLIRNLTELKEDKVIQVDNEGIHILNLPKLQTLFV
ncbi:MAG: response regulator [Saprospiraceae bacterium]|nr:response regulator [Saprospiraceae bacterium]